MQPTFWRNGKSSRNAKDFFKGFFLVPGPLSVSSPAIDCFSRCSPFFFDFFPWKKTVVWNALLKRKSRSHLDSLFLSLSRFKIEIRRFVQRSKLASYILCLKINHSSISEPNEVENEETRKNSITEFLLNDISLIRLPRVDRFFQEFLRPAILFSLIPVPSTLPAFHRPCSLRRAASSSIKSKISTFPCLGLALLKSKRCLGCPGSATLPPKAAIPVAQKRERAFTIRPEQPTTLSLNVQSFQSTTFNGGRRIYG